MCDAYQGLLWCLRKTNNVAVVHMEYISIWTCGMHAMAVVRYARNVYSPPSLSCVQSRAISVIDGEGCLEKMKLRFVTTTT